MLDAYQTFSESPVAWFYGFAFAAMLAGAVLELLYGWFARRPLYTIKDTAANAAMYIGYFAINLLWIPVMLSIYLVVRESALIEFTVGGWHLGNNGLWWEWVVLFVLEDLAFYWFHRASHRCRLL